IIHRHPSRDNNPASARAAGNLGQSGLSRRLNVYTHKSEMADVIRWTVKVSKETDIAVRSLLAERGGKKGDLSKFIERAVQKEVLRATVQQIQERNADLPQDDLQSLIDEACASVRAEFWVKRSW